VVILPLKCGVAVPPDDNDHWAPELEEAVGADGKAADAVNPQAAAEGMDEWNEWAEWSEWQGEAEPRFEVPRTSGVVPHSPAAG
jgi:hypothetical protein